MIKVRGGIADLFRRYEPLPELTQHSTRESARLSFYTNCASTPLWGCGKNLQKPLCAISS